MLRLIYEIKEAKTLSLQLDVTDQSSAEWAVQSVISEWDALDILVNNPGVASASIRESAEERIGRRTGTRLSP